MSKKGFTKYKNGVEYRGENKRMSVYTGDEKFPIMVRFQRLVKDSNSVVVLQKLDKRRMTAEIALSVEGASALCALLANYLNHFETQAG